MWAQEGILDLVGMSSVVDTAREPDSDLSICGGVGQVRRRGTSQGSQRVVSACGVWVRSMRGAAETGAT